MIEQIQPFCATEIPYIDLTTQNGFQISESQYNLSFQEDEASII